MINRIAIQVGVSNLSSNRNLRNTGRGRNDFGRLIWFMVVIGRTSTLGWAMVYEGAPFPRVLTVYAFFYIMVVLLFMFLCLCAMVYSYYCILRYFWKRVCVNKILLLLTKNEPNGSPSFR